MVEHSLLGEGLFHVTGADGHVACLSLPQVLARLSAGEDLRFDTLRPHQRAPWHAFLVQLAYLALEDEDDPQLPHDAGVWITLLRKLAPGHDDDAPWCLLNTNWQQPAFLQAPCSPESEGKYDKTEYATQAFDLLDTARNHDEKTQKLLFTEAALDTLIYGLISLQGWAAYGGRGLYNSMRMNGGVSSRSQFRLIYERGSGNEFVRDFAALVESRAMLYDAEQRIGMGTASTSPYRLLWLPPWDDEGLSFGEVHPYCLEVTRKTRVARQGETLVLLRASSTGPRIDADSLNGSVLDPWVPIVRAESPKALTAQPDALSYRRVQQILFDPAAIHLPVLALPSESERRLNRSCVLLAQVLVRVKRGTEGLLSREIPLPPAIVSQLGSPAATLAARAKQFVNLAGLASGKVYRSALLQFVDGSADVDWKNRDFTRAVQPWVDRYEHAIDEFFFVELFDTIESRLNDTAAQTRWVRWLADASVAHLGAAVKALPTRDGSRRFARARAERLLQSSLRKQFGPLLGEPHGTSPAAASETNPEETTHG